MRVAAVALAASIAGAASSARAGATLLVPEFADSVQTGAATRARLDLVRALGAYPDIQIAPLSKFKRLAVKHRLNPKQLGTGHAAAVLAHTEGLDGVLMGIILNGQAGPALRLALFDPTGAAVFRTELPLEGGGALTKESADSAASSVAASLGVTTPPRTAAPPPEAPPPAPTTTAPPAVSAPAAGTTPEQRYPQNQAGVTEAPAESSPPPAAGEPLFSFALSLPISLRDFSLTEPAASSQPVLTFDTSSPYAGIAGDLALFPFAHAAYALQGLGLLASGSAGFISSTFQGQSFGSQDVRVGADLTYRLLVHAFSSIETDPAFGLRLGFGWFHFGVDQPNPVDLASIDRIAPKIGLDYVQGIASWLRIALSGAIFPAATPGGNEETLYGTPASSFGWEIQLGLSGLFGLGGFGWVAKADYLAFSDSFSGTGTQPGVKSSSESYIDFWFGLSYAFY